MTRVVIIALIMFHMLMTAAFFVSTAVYAQEQIEINNGSILESINRAQSIDVEKKLDEIQVKTSTIIEKIWLMAKAYSVPLLILSFLAGAVFLLLSIVFGQAMKRLATSMIGMGIVAFVLFNYAPQLTGMVLSFVNSIMGK